MDALGILIVYLLTVLNTLTITYHQPISPRSPLISPGMAAPETFFLDEAEVGRVIKPLPKMAPRKPELHSNVVVETMPRAIQDFSSSRLFTYNAPSSSLGGTNATQQICIMTDSAGLEQNDVLGQPFHRLAELASVASQALPLTNQPGDVKSTATLLGNLETHPPISTVAPSAPSSSGKSFTFRPEAFASEQSSLPHASVSTTSTFSRNGKPVHSHGRVKNGGRHSGARKNRSTLPISVKSENVKASIDSSEEARDLTDEDLVPLGFDWTDKPDKDELALFDTGLQATHLREGANILESVFADNHTTSSIDCITTPPEALPAGPARSDKLTFYDQQQFSFDGYDYSQAPTFKGKDKAQEVAPIEQLELVQSSGGQQHISSIYNMPFEQVQINYVDPFSASPYHRGNFAVTPTSSYNTSMASYSSLSGALGPGTCLPSSNTTLYTGSASRGITGLASNRAHVYDTSYPSSDPSAQGSRLPEFVTAEGRGAINSFNAELDDSTTETNPSPVVYVEGEPLDGNVASTAGLKHAGAPSTSQSFWVTLDSEDNMSSVAMTTVNRSTWAGEAILSSQDLSDSTFSGGVPTPTAVLEDDALSMGAMGEHEGKGHSAVETKTATDEDEDEDDGLERVISIYEDRPSDICTSPKDSTSSKPSLASQSSSKANNSAQLTTHTSGLSSQALQQAGDTASTSFTNRSVDPATKDSNHQTEDSSAAHSTILTPASLGSSDDIPTIGKNETSSPKLIASSPKPTSASSAEHNLPDQQAIDSSPSPIASQSNHTGSNNVHLMERSSAAGTGVATSGPSSSLNPMSGIDKSEITAPPQVNTQSVQVAPSGPGTFDNVVPVKSAIAAHVSYAIVDEDVDMVPSFAYDKHVERTEGYDVSPARALGHSAPGDEIIMTQGETMPVKPLLNNVPYSAPLSESKLHGILAACATIRIWSGIRIRQPRAKNGPARYNHADLHRCLHRGSKSRPLFNSLKAAELRRRISASQPTYAAGSLRRTPLFLPHPPRRLPKPVPMEVDIMEPPIATKVQEEDDFAPSPMDVDECLPLSPGVRPPVHLLAGLQEPPMLLNHEDVMPVEVLGALSVIKAPLLPSNDSIQLVKDSAQPPGISDQSHTDPKDRTARDREHARTLFKRITELSSEHDPHRKAAVAYGKNFLRHNTCISHIRRPSSFPPRPQAPVKSCEHGSQGQRPTVGGKVLLWVPSKAGLDVCSACTAKKALDEAPARKQPVLKSSGKVRDPARHRRRCSRPQQRREELLMAAKDEVRLEVQFLNEDFLAMPGAYPGLP